MPKHTPLKSNTQRSKRPALPRIFQKPSAHRPDAAPRMSVSECTYSPDVSLHEYLDLKIKQAYEYHGRSLPRTARALDLTTTELDNELHNLGLLK